MTKQELKEKANGLPLSPGVYIMMDAQGTVIYVGKAKKLKNRVSQYFQDNAGHNEKTRRMVSRVDHFDTIIASSEFEALILENALIKQYMPRYNILLKDDKGYHYIRIETKPFGRITAEKQKTEKDAVYLGPYVSSMVTKQTVDEANKAFLLPTCNRRFPEDFRKGRPCLNFHIKQCMGVCTGKISAENYREAMNEAVDFIKSGGTQSVEALTEKMESAAENLDFERAARYRDRIAAINKVTQQQKVIAYNHKSLDVIASVQSQEHIYLSVLVFRDGRLRDKQDHSFDFLESVEDTLEEFLLGYYIGATDQPSEIFLDTRLENADLVSRAIGERNGKKLTITVPQRGQSLQLVEMARNNAAQSLATKTRRTGRELTAVDELGRILGLTRPPVFIEAFDISNYGGQTIVGGMIVFENGRPQKKLYKKFTIKEQHTPDDYAAMDQMLSRRVLRYLEHQKGESTPDGFERLPDLWLIDGGATHVAVARDVLQRYDLQIPVFGMVKDSKHRTRAISAGSEEIAISMNKGVFALVTGIQDEVHRYSIEFSRQSHKKNSLTARLLEVEGIGESRVTALYQHFKTNKAMKAADIEELAAVKGMNKTAAKNLFAFLHQND